MAAAALVLLCPGGAAAAVNSWTAAGPAGADVHALAVQATAPPTLYAGTSAGVYRSVDDGDSWTASGLSGSVTDLAADPVTLDTVYAIAAGAVHRTVDGGDHWTQVRAAGASSVAVDSQAVYVGAVDGVWRSADGGDSWTATGLSTGTVEGLALSPLDPGRLWAEVHSGPATYAVHRSDDGGASWSQTSDFPRPRVAIAADPADADSAWTAGMHGVYRTADAGAHWSQSLAPGGPREFVSLAVSQADPSHLYAGDDHTAVVRSVDGGATWTAVGSTGLPWLAGYEISALAVDPGAPDRVFAGTDGAGVYAIELMAPENDVPPSITGTSRVPSTLTCAPGSWRNVSDPFAFEWRRDGIAVGAGQQYALTDLDAGAEIECVVTGASAGGVLGVASAAVVVEPDPAPDPGPTDPGPTDPGPTAPIQPEPVPDAPSVTALRKPRPRSISAPRVTGGAAAGRTLRCGAGRWKSASTFAFSWTRDGRRIKGAATSRYRVRPADAGKRIGCVVTATGPGGSVRAAAKPVRVKRARR